MNPVLRTFFHTNPNHDEVIAAAQGPHQTGEDFAGHLDSLLDVIEYLDNKIGRLKDAATERDLAKFDSLP